MVGRFLRRLWDRDPGGPASIVALGLVTFLLLAFCVAVAGVLAEHGPSIVVEDYFGRAEMEDT